MDPSSGHEEAEPEPEPEHSETGGTDDPQVLVVGAGPAGLECARVLAGAGRRVTVADAAPTAGGMVLVAARGSGRDRLRLAVDWLAQECRRLGVQIDTGWPVTAAEVAAARATGVEVVLATGSRPVEGRYGDGEHPRTVDAVSALAAGTADWPSGPVVVHDPVGDAVGVSVAESLAAEGRRVTLVTPDPVAATLQSRTGDLADANVRLQRAGVDRRLRSQLAAVDAAGVTVSDVWTGATTHLAAAVVVDCGHRLPEERLYVEVGDPAVGRAGDCVAPRSILEAVLEGRRAAAAILGRGGTRHRVGVTAASGVTA